jgi:TonB-dependent SusC/RagA subfamily outer membrane receptor
MKLRLPAILLLIVLQFLPGISYGQKANKKITITGKVMDATGKPVSGAVIFIDKVKTDVLTDGQGYYKIKVKPDAKEILAFTLFYGVSEKVINGLTNIDFILTGENQGEKTKVADKKPVSPGNETSGKQETTRIKGFDPDDVRNASYQTIYDMIRGRFAGVEVSGKNIRIMGSSSLNVSTEPLFVIDGVIVNNIDNISPQTVKSIEVLKGPDATVYGTRGSNGVIVITRITGKDR